MKVFLGGSKVSSGEVGNASRSRSERVFRRVGDEVNLRSAGRANGARCGVKANREDYFGDVADALDAWLKKHPHAPRYGETAAERALEKGGLKG